MAEFATVRCRVCGDTFTYRVLGPKRTRCFKESCKTKKLPPLVDNTPQVVVNLRTLEQMRDTGPTHEERLVLKERIGKVKREKYWRERRLKG